MPYIFPSPGSISDSALRNGLVLHPEEHSRRYEHEAELFRATNPGIVPTHKLEVREAILRRQYELAIRAGEAVVRADTFDLPVSPVLSEREVKIFRTL